MKLVTLLVTALLTTALSAQTTVTVTTGPGNAMQTYYSLQDGVASSVALADWDLAFEVVGFTGSILANTANGIQVYKTPYTLAQWSVLDTTGLAAYWPAQQNSEVNWSSGALNQGLSANPFDLGWGIYNMVTHNIAGDSLFVMKLADGSWKKLRIDGYALATDAFTFTWANVDGSNEQTGNLVRSDYAGKSFGYYSLVSNAAMDHEPVASAWDLVFTKYISLVLQPTPTFYPVVGVLNNRGEGALQVDGVPTSAAQWWGSTFSDSINIIGYDWKTFNMTTFQYEYAQDRTYFVQDQVGNIWKLIFTAYGGGSTGDITFIQEMVSAASVTETAMQGTVLAYPNPVTSGQVQLVIDVPSPHAVLSIIDINGRVVLSQDLNGLNGLSLRNTDVSGLQQGLYLVRIAGEGVSTTARLVIE
ncbi:MAG: T9SS type A sorting domain-containing protein [Flavobacteriales bacterium]